MFRSISELISMPRMLQSRHGQDILYTVILYITLHKKTEEYCIATVNKN